MTREALDPQIAAGADRAGRPGSRSDSPASGPTPRRAARAPRAGPSTWSTASVGHPAETSPAELSALGEHLGTCRVGPRRSALRYGLQALQAFAAAHVVTCVAAVALVIALAWRLG